MERLREFWNRRKSSSGKENYWRQAVSPGERRMGLISGLALSAAVAFIFYNSIRALVLSLIIMPCWMQWWMSERQKAKESEFEDQLRTALQSLTAALETGRSFENAMAEVCREQEREGSDRTMVGNEFKLMAQELTMNIPSEAAWVHFAERCEQRDVREMAMVITAGKRTGGNLISVMRRCMIQITEKMEIRQQIETVLAARKMELRLMLVMPFVILLYMRMVFGNMISLLYGNVPGVMVMTFCLMLYTAAGVMGQRIVRTLG